MLFNSGFDPKRRGIAMIGVRPDQVK